ncbi:MAG: STAS domain-containing protein [Proteobacteria bacterium]|nr:STAS domain-containing protein [Pseudomonadota bacterium]
MTARFIPEGPLSLDTVSQLREAGEKAMAASPVCFDLGRITQVDSSAISLILEWKRMAMDKGVELEFATFPDHLLTLAELYGVHELIIQVPHDNSH